MYIYHINLVYQFDQKKLGISKLVINIKLILIKLIAIKRKHVIKIHKLKGKKEVCFLSNYNTVSY